MNITHQNALAAAAFSEIEDTIIQVAEMFFDADDAPYKDLMRCAASCEQWRERLTEPAVDPYKALIDAPDIPEPMFTLETTDGPDSAEDITQPATHHTMKAGSTEYEVGTEVEIIAIADQDPDEAIGIVGSRGTLTHPFGDQPDTILGVYQTHIGNQPCGAQFPSARCGLCRGDTIRIIETGKIETV